jgi:large conductance mechanosensitive channel
MRVHPIQSFVGEYKKFVNRGNVVDMAVGVIIGGAFTAIVTALSGSILEPIINFALSEWFGNAHTDGLYTVLKEGYAEDGSLDLTASIYIDWSTFINTIIHFLLVALVLFCILRTINRVREEYAELSEKARKGKPTREERRAMKAAGIKLRDKAAVAAWYAEQAMLAEEARLAAEEQARLDRLANPTTEDLLKDIRYLLQRLAPEEASESEQK